jgi:hypothetical protein
MIGSARDRISHLPCSKQQNLTWSWAPPLTCEWLSWTMSAIISKISIMWTGCIRWRSWTKMGMRRWSTWNNIKKWIRSLNAMDCFCDFHGFVKWVNKNKNYHVYLLYNLYFESMLWILDEFILNISFSDKKCYQLSDISLVGELESGAILRLSLKIWK